MAGNRASSAGASSQSMGPASGPTPERLMQFGFAYAAPLILEAAIHHGVFDLLDSGPRTLEQVANETGASQRGLRAVMDALVGLEFLARDGQGRYALTPESAAFLVSTKPDFRGGLFRHASKQLIPAWLELNEVVRTGKPAAKVNDDQQGVEFFTHLVEDIFTMSYGPARMLATALHVEQKKQKYHVLDIAAGSGVWGIALAQASPNVRVTAVDWEGMLPVTRRVAERYGVADRFSYIAGDLDEADFGRGGGDGYQLATLGHILHSEGEVRSRSLLKKTFNALAPGATIAIAEFVVNADRTGPVLPLIFAVNMLVNTEVGDAYSFEQIRSWLEEAGFAAVQKLDVHSHSPLLLAEKP